MVSLRGGTVKSLIVKVRYKQPHVARFLYQNQNVAVSIFTSSDIDIPQSEQK
ncbi:hypothetical protein PPEP_a0356 [Pseudoalteromonas peptidolytica F12-50-A1]|uniref:Uncharacterized protein n=1 Tax=Pseudoalteromonas peptidolytica F12-50-A1 TaxID=1315280 RepID=A0A8I0MTD2_9GAMM|nr:hypothetical protein [Pseudoalteromonas peptidolytica F12-50-A1]